MSFDEYLIIHFPKYWGISKKRVAFNQLPMPMQWGVYLEFFDSVGILINVYNPYVPDGSFILTVTTDKGTATGGTKTRQEAQQEAIKKAFEILEG